ncbi:MAG: hypothetical protein GY951_16525 [Psychromonas sp.]|nr:hypothetical protein [Psychromonas sp.]
MNKTNIAYVRLVSNAQVVMLGENHHYYPEYQDEVVKSLQQLKQLGYTHFAMEMLQSDQDVSNSKSSIYNLEDCFSIGHSKIYKQAKSLGFSIIGLDMPLSKQQTYNTPRRLYKERNYWMVDELLNNLKPNHKVVVFVHHGHALGSTGNLRVPDEHGMIALIKRKNISLVYIQIAGGHLGDVCGGRISAIANEAQKQSTQNKRFVTTGGLGIDHVIHLSQNCTVK